MRVTLCNIRMLQNVTSKITISLQIDECGVMWLPPEFDMIDHMPMPTHEIDCEFWCPMNKLIKGFSWICYL